MDFFVKLPRFLINGIVDIVKLFDYYVSHPDKMPSLYRHLAETEPVERCVCDFLSGMTDRYAIETYNELNVPRVWRGLGMK